jgi:hypothetical protein
LSTELHGEELSNRVFVWEKILGHIGPKNRDLPALIEFVNEPATCGIEIVKKEKVLWGDPKEGEVAGLCAQGIRGAA